MATEIEAVQTLNADELELQKFGDLAHKWWDLNSEFKPLHAINPLRLNCILSESIFFKGAEVVGIDLGEKALNVAKLHQLESGAKVDYQYIAVEQLAVQQPASFDVVTCMEMLEHVPDPTAIISACAQLVKPGGSVFFSTINRNPKSYLFAVVGAEYVLNLLPKGTHDYAKFIKPSELVSWARSAQLEMQAIRGMSYNPINQHYSIGDDVSVNYMLHTILAV